MRQTRVAVVIDLDVVRRARAFARLDADATTRLVALYAEEKSARGAHLKADSGPDLPGKEAVAKAADMDGAQLRRLRPLVEASKSEVKAATKAIERVGLQSIAVAISGSKGAR
jgi:hypothetical protein